MEKQLKNYATLGMSVIVKLAMKTKWDNRNYTMPLQARRSTLRPETNN